MIEFLDDVTERMVIGHQKQIDTILIELVTDRIGHVPSMTEIAEHATAVTFPGSNQETTYMWDGKPLLKVMPYEVEQRQGDMTIKSDVIKYVAY